MSEPLGEPEASAGTFANSIATAPGDLPMPEVMARLAAQEQQFRHDNTIVPLAPQPGQQVEVWATSGRDMRLSRAALFYTTGGQQPDTSSAAVPMEIATVDWDPRTGYLTRRRAAIPAQPAGTVVRYRIGGWRPGNEASPDPDVWAHDGQGFWFHFPDEHGISTFAYRVEPPGPPLPAWTSDAVIYQIFLDRFHPGTPGGAFKPHPTDRTLHGGTLKGVKQALPYIAELGATCLWLSPLNAALTYHRYDATDLYTVDATLGTNEDLRALVDAAHVLEMRVILDFVPSHVSWRHAAFVAAQADRTAPTASWFTFYEWPHKYRSFLQISRTLVSLNTDDPGAREHIIGSAVQWLRDYGVDGFRLDHAIGPSMDFWVALRDAMAAVAPDALTVGEVTDTPDSLRRYRGKLHGVLDFPLAQALRLAFGSGDWNMSLLDGFLDAYERYMAEGPGRVSFLDNHDMNRFLFVAGQDVTRLKLAALCQFTLDATPVVYYGTEIGMSHKLDIAGAPFGDAEARRDMIWDESEWDHDLLAFYRSLIRLRHENPVLRHGPRRTVHLDAAAGTYAYARGKEEDGAGRLLVLFNLSAHERTISIPGMASPLPACLLATGAAPRISTEGGALLVTLAPDSGQVIGEPG